VRIIETERVVMSVAATIARRVAEASAAKREAHWELVHEVANSDATDTDHIIEKVIELGYDPVQFEKDVAIVVDRYADDALVDSIPVLREEIARLDGIRVMATKLFEENKRRFEEVMARYRAEVKAAEEKITAAERARRRLISGCPYRDLLDKQSAIGRALIETERLCQDWNERVRTAEQWANVDPAKSQTPGYAKQKKLTAENELPALRQRLDEFRDEASRLTQERDAIERKIQEP